MECGPWADLQESCPILDLFWRRIVPILRVIRPIILLLASIVTLAEEAAEKTALLFRWRRLAGYRLSIGRLNWSSGWSRQYHAVGCWRRRRSYGWRSQAKNLGEKTSVVP